MINIPFIRRQKKNAMKTQKSKSAPGPEVDLQSERNITNNPHKEETRDPLDAMIVEMTVLKTEKEVATLVTDTIEVRGMNATKDPMIEGIEEMTIDTKVAATTRTNTTIMTDTAAVTTDTRLTTITNNRWVAIEAVIEEIRTTIEDAAMKEVPAPTTECSRETIGLAVTIMIVATEEVEAMISGVVTTTEAAPIVGTSTMTLVDRNNAEVDHQGSSNIQEETITAEITTVRQRS